MNLHIPSNLSADQAADFLGLSKSTLSKMRLTGDGPIFIKMGRRVAYQPDDLQNWVKENRRRSTSDLGDSNA
ncbi:MAG: helix-turn-helix transcriptional regulator [Maricaulaceae bacterium]